MARKRKLARAAYRSCRASGVCVQTGCERKAGRGHAYCPTCLTAKNAWTKAAKQKARAKGKVAA